MKNLGKSIIIFLIIGFISMWFLGIWCIAFPPYNLIYGAIIGLIFALIYLLLTGYNQLISAKNGVSNAWAQIDVQLRRRMDLIPNIVDTVKGYAGHENSTLSEVTQARASLQNADTVKGTEAANNKLTDTLNHLFMVAESYPDLKANTNFQDLQNQLRETEGLIANNRQIFNNAVLFYNNLCQQIPTNIVAIIFNFQTADYFQTDDESRVAPKVKF